jgi:hypothetical protein
LLDNGEVSTFPRLGIDAITDKVFEVMFCVRLAPRYKRARN